jgi:hypothetical protein
VSSQTGLLVDDAFVREGQQITVAMPATQGVHTELAGLRASSVPPHRFGEGHGEIVEHRGATMIGGEGPQHVGVPLSVHDPFQDHVVAVVQRVPGGHRDQPMFTPCGTSRSFNTRRRNTSCCTSAPPTQLGTQRQAVEVLPAPELPRSTISRCAPTPSAPPEKGSRWPSCPRPDLTRWSLPVADHTSTRDRGTGGCGQTSRHLRQVTTRPVDVALAATGFRSTMFELSSPPGARRGVTAPGPTRSHHPAVACPRAP